MNPTCSAPRYFFVVIMMTTLLCAAACKSTKPQERISIVPPTKLQEAVVENFFEAQKQKMMGNTDQAAALFAAVIAAAPAHPAASYELARLQLTQKKYADAVKNAANAYISDKKNEWYATIYLQTLVANRELKQANVVYAERIAQNPADVPLALEYAQNLIATQQLNDALAVLNKLEATQGISPEIIDAKKNIYVLQNKPEKALKEIEKLAETYPNSPEVQGYLAQLYLELKQIDKAQVTLEKSIKNNPNDAESLMILSEIYRIKANKKQWLQTVSRAFDTPTMDIDVKVKWLVQSLDFAADAEVSDSAAAFAQKTTYTTPYDPKAYAVLGDVLLNQNKIQAAKQAYLQSIALDKTQKYAVWEQVLLIDLRQDSTDLLATHATQALESFSMQPFLFYAQGYAFQKQQKYPQTVQVITEGLTYISDNNTLEMQMLMLLGEAHHETKNYEKSGEAFEKALRIAPNNALLMNNYAYYIALENGNLVRAENFAQRANTLNPKNASFEDTYAYILFKKQAYAEAKVWIERAVQNSPTPDATILEHKGDILYKLGLENEAVDAWQMAQKLGTNNAVLIKKITTKQYHNE